MYCISIDLYFWEWTGLTEILRVLVNLCFYFILLVSSIYLGQLVHSQDYFFLNNKNSLKLKYNKLFIFTFHSVGDVEGIKMLLINH